MAYNERQEQCIALLRQKAQALGRLPQKSDFSPEVMGQIKNILGPWPRALEMAGLKAQNTRQETHPHQAAADAEQAGRREEERAWAGYSLNR